MVVEIPHAGVEVPREVRSELRVSDAVLLRDADTWVDELWCDAVKWGATVIGAKVSRLVVDLNRERDDIDAGSVRGGPREKNAAQGVIWREGSEGEKVLAGPLEWEKYERRLERFWRPYHEALAMRIEGLHRRYGRVLLLSGHSMPSWGRDRITGELRRWADVVPGTRGRSTAEGGVIDEIERYFSAAGLSVRHDEPFRGGATTGRWGRPGEGFHAVQIEVRRGVYMHETEMKKKPESLRWMRGVMSGLVERLCAGM